MRMFMPCWVAAVASVALPTQANDRDNFWVFGVQADGSSLYFEDMEGEGSASTFNDVTALKLKLIADIDRDSRTASAISYRNFTIDPDVNRVGQDVTLVSFETQYQTKIGFGRGAFLWAGGGIGANQYSYKERHYVDRDGYTTENFDDLTGIGFYGVASVGREFEISPSWLLGVQAQYEYHFGGNLRATSIGLSILYN